MKKLLPAILAAAFLSHPAISQDDSNGPDLKPLPPDGFVTLEQVRKDFTENPSAAMAKYNGMRVTVYGRVGQVEQSADMEGDPMTVYLQNANNITPDVKCVFNQAGVPQDGQVVVQNSGREADDYKPTRRLDTDWGAGEGLPKVTPVIIEGQMVAISGTYDNFVAGDVVLTNCQQVPQGKLMGLLEEHGIDVE